MIPRFPSGRRLIVAAVVGLAAVGAVAATADTSYPLDGWESTGIRRLRAYAMMQDGRMRGDVKLPPGALLPDSAIVLTLAGQRDSFDVGPHSPRHAELQAGLDRIFRGRPSYRAAVLDLTDPMAPKYAAVRETEGYYPGSVGKLLVTTGLFNELARLYPDDTDARRELLKTTMVVADGFTVPNSHTVPIVADDWSGVVHRAIRVGDSFSLYEWVDHALSPSSNAAGSTIWKQALLINEFGLDYPPTAEQEAAFFRETSKAELARRSIEIVEEPLRAAGLDTTLMYMRGYFTRGAQRVIPPQPSRVVPQELVRWLLKVEQGAVVDEWSSLEMKRLMYFTRRRYRYAAAPVLRDAAVYFKSGSLYRCREEAGYQCVQYKGNAENLMHSVAIVEAPAAPEPEQAQRRYLISMMSNVLKVNSANEHMEIAAQVDALIKAVNP